VPSSKQEQCLVSEQEQCLEFEQEQCLIVQHILDLSSPQSCSEGPCCKRSAVAGAQTPEPNVPKTTSPHIAYIFSDTVYHPASWGDDVRYSEDMTTRTSEQEQSTLQGQGAQIHIKLYNHCWPPHASTRTLKGTLEG